MKWYIAARFELKEEVRAMYKVLEARGHTITDDWTKHQSIKPYDKNAEMARQYTNDDLTGVMNADVVLILSDEAGIGMYTELGVAMASQLLKGSPLIFITGEHTARNMFYFHQTVMRRPTASIVDIIDEAEKMVKK